MMFSLVLTAQETEPTPGMGRIEGRVSDAITGKPVEYATVSVYKVKDSSLITGGITDNHGHYNISDVPFGRYFIEISFIGYEKIIVKDIFINPQSIVFRVPEAVLLHAATTIDAIEIVADKPNIEYRIDKKVINVTQDIANAGGSAANILENAPSIQSDMEGNISLRGSSNFKVMIDGRPSILQGSDALRSIPASTVQTIEIITNPSAKYDPDGVAGIINVVLKKQKKEGINGIINTSIGNGDKYSADMLINYKKAKNNFFIGADFSDNNVSIQRKYEQKTWLTDTIHRITKADGKMYHSGSSIRTGLERYINDKTTFVFSANAGLKGRGRDIRSQYRQYSSLQNMYLLQRNTSNDADRFVSFNTSYIQHFDSENHKLEASAYFDIEQDRNHNQIIEEISDASWVSTGIYQAQQQTKEKEQQNTMRIKADYTRPLKKRDSKFEAGLQANLDYDKAVYIFDDWDDVGIQWMRNHGQSNAYNFRNNIYGAYSMLANTYGGFGYQLGLRTEVTDRLLEQLTMEKKFSIYRFDYFPTLHLSRNLPWNQQLMVNYSRRINRPGERELNPFRSYFDKRNVREGNPQLQSEYVNSYEIGYQKKIQSSFLALEAYYRETYNKISRFTRLLNDTLMLHTYENLESDYATGIEWTSNIFISKWWNIYVGGNIFRYRINAASLEEGSMQTTKTWDARINSNFRMKHNLRLQLSGFYVGPSITVQGRRDGFAMTNIGVRKDFFNRKLSATMQIQDIFQGMKMKFHSQTTNFENSFLMKREAPVFQISLSYRINNYNKPERSMGGNGDRINIEDGGM